MLKQARIITAAAAVALAGCEQKPESKTTAEANTLAAQMHSSNTETLERFDGVTVSLKEIAGDYFLVASSGIGNAIIQHSLPPMERSKGRGFSFKPVEGTVGSCQLYLLNVHGLEYVLAVDRNARGDGAVSIARKN